MTDCVQRYLAGADAGVVLDVGAAVATRNTTSPHREIFEAIGWTYHGLDLVERDNVDIVARDPFLWPIARNTYDAVISGQMMEHNRMFWLTILEMARVLKPSGFMIHIAPSRGREHNAPTDCWRFYRNGMSAIAEWAGLECLEATTDWSENQLKKVASRKPGIYAKIPHRGRFAQGEWGDTVGVFRKPTDWDPSTAARYMSALSRRLKRA